MKNMTFKAQGEYIPLKRSKKSTLIEKIRKLGSKSKKYRKSRRIAALNLIDVGEGE